LKQALVIRGKRSEFPPFTHDDFAAAVESLFLLVQEIASQVESAPEIPQEAMIAGREEAYDTSMPLSGEGEGIGEQSSALLGGL
jgi:hypothetical protein